MTVCVGESTIKKNMSAEIPNFGFICLRQDLTSTFFLSRCFRICLQTTDSFYPVNNFNFTLFENVFKDTVVKCFNLCDQPIDKKKHKITVLMRFYFIS